MSSKPLERLTSIEIEQEIYDKLKEQRLKNGIKMKDFVNQALKLKLGRNKKIEELLPDLEFVHVHDNQIVISDKKKNEFVGIKINKNKRLFCQKENSESCNHVLFAWTLSEVEQLTTTNAT